MMNCSQINQFSERIRFRSSQPYASSVFTVKTFLVFSSLHELLSRIRWLANIGKGHPNGTLLSGVRSANVFWNAKIVKINFRVNEFKSVRQNKRALEKREALIYHQTDSYLNQYLANWSAQAESTISSKTPKAPPWKPNLCSMELASSPINRN